MAFTPRTQKARFVLLIASFAILVNPSAALPAQKPARKTVTPQISIVAGSTTQIEDAQWALNRFRAAGIELPSLQIIFHDDYQACGNREGVLRIAGERAEIHECERDRSRSRRSLLHELAHAWDHMAGGITREQQARFLEARNLSSWDADGLPWQERGEEQAAEIVAWGLMLDAAPIPTRVGDHGPQDESLLAAAFEILTGGAPLFSPGPGTSEVAVVGATGEQRAITNRALDRFEAIGLHLPYLTALICDAMSALSPSRLNGTSLMVCGSLAERRIVCRGMKSEGPADA